MLVLVSSSSPPSRRELGARIEDPRDDHCHYPIAFFGGFWGDERIELELAQRTEHGRDVPVGERTLDRRAMEGRRARREARDSRVSGVKSLCELAREP